MLDDVKRVFPSSKCDGRKDHLEKKKDVRIPLIADLPLQIPENDPKDRKRILRAFKKVKKSDGSLAIMQKLFDNNLLIKAPRLIEILIKPLNHSGVCDEK